MTQKQGRKPASYASKMQDTKDGRGISQAPPEKGRSWKAVQHKELKLTGTFPYLGWGNFSTVWQCWDKRKRPGEPAPRVTGGAQ